MAFDFLIVSSFVLLFAFEPGTPTRELLLIAILAGAVRYGMRGGVLTAIAAIPVAAWFEQRRAATVHGHFRVDFFVFQVFSGLVMALLVGWLVNRVETERRNVQRRVEEAEALRDELSRRADLLDAANRCARALSSSLDLDEATGAFVDELRSLVPFERMAIVLADEGTGRVIATAGVFAAEVMPPGTVLTLDRSLLADVVSSGKTIVRPDLELAEYAEEPRLRALGINSRVAAPLNVGGRTIGLISVGRAERHAFSEHEIELMSLLGSLVASAVQNIRAYESERRTVEELQRLSMMRADFVSLVSHELRSPMAAVIGASRTLQQRWRELSSEQREAFLALIGDESTRLATLIGDVLDTSRIEAGTFSYRFSDIDIAALVRDSIATAAVGQDEVPLNAMVREVPLVRGDPGRLRQVVGQPDRQRGQVLADGHRRRRRRQTAERLGRRRRLRSRPRDPARRPAPDLREVRPRFGRQLEARHRSRALHRTLDRRGARRHRRRLVGSRTRRDVPADRPRRRRGVDPPG